MQVLTENLTNFTQSFPDWLQWLAVALVAAIPFVESYFGSAVGVFAGIHPVFAVAAAFVGNFICMFAVVMTAHRTRQAILARKGNHDDTVTEETPRSKSKQRIIRMFHTWGVAGVSLLGQTFLPSQITSGLLVSVGAPARTVVIWQAVSIVLWGTVFATIAYLGVLSL